MQQSIEAESNSRHGALWLALLAGALILLIHIAYLYLFYPFIIADDAFISLRYAERLLAGKGLTWNDGERVEGYSDLLWILLNAALGWLGIGLPVAAQWLGVACTLLTLPVLLWHVRQAGLNRWAALAGSLAFAVTTPVAIWARAGMETPLVMLLFACVGALAWGLLASARRATAALMGAALAAICLLRPEGPVYVLAVAVAWMWCSVLPVARRLRLAAIFCLVPFAAVMLQLAFRLDYYHQLLPNTVMAKVAFTGGRLKSGFNYIIDALFFFAPLLAYGFINYWNTRRQPEEKLGLNFFRFLLAVVIMISAAILISGGDYLPCFRAFMPLVPLIILMLMHGVAWGLRYAPVGKEWAFIGCVLACHLWLQYTVDSDQLPKSSGWVREAEEIGLALKEKYGAAQPTIAVFAAGAIPYYSQLPALDVFGLNDAYLTRHRDEIATFGSGVIGHDLFSSSYVESKKPDILVFDVPGLHPLCDAERHQCTDLLSHYRAETLPIPGHEVRIWVRKDSRKL